VNSSPVESLSVCALLLFTITPSSITSMTTLTSFLLLPPPLLYYYHHRSLGHTTLSPDSEDYWDFSWDEMAAYDMPACIDAVLNRTASSSLIWVGHSQGTMISFGGLIHNPAYQEKVSLLIQLAPVAYLSHIDSVLLKWLARFDVDVVIEKLGVKRFLPHENFYELLGADLCDPLPGVCDDFLSVLTGYPEDVNNTRLQVWLCGGGG
jgi:pimeloyl-ACP methyl ester carboxylesterase